MTVATTDKIVRFVDPEGDLWFINLSKAQVKQEGSHVEIEFKLDDEDLDDEYDPMNGDEADLGFENMPDNFAEYLHSLGREIEIPVHPREGSWKYWAVVDDGEVSLFW